MDLVAFARKARAAGTGGSVLSAALFIATADVFDKRTKGGYGGAYDDDILLKGRSPKVRDRYAWGGISQGRTAVSSVPDSLRVKSQFGVKMLPISTVRQIAQTIAL